MNELKEVKPGSKGFGYIIEHGSGYIEPNDIRNKPFISEMKKLSEGGKIMAEPLVLFVVLQKYGVLNKNGRLYSERLLRREADKYQQLIDTRSAFGESDHPESSIISNDRISHEIKKIWWEGQTLVGELEIIMSPGFINQGIISCEGDRIANYLRKGLRIGVSSRGIGTLEENREGHMEVQDDFELICWDIVTSPSTPGAYMFNKSKDATPFMESKEAKTNLLINKLNNFLTD